MSIEQKKGCILQGIETLYHISFEPDRGLVLDQLSNMNYTSMIDDASSNMTDSVIVHQMN